MKKISLIVLALTLAALTLCSCSGIGKNPTSGTVDTPDGKIVWEINDEGELKVDGTGTLIELPVVKTAVKTACVGPGITAIGSGAFADMPSLEEIELPDGLCEIFADAFKNSKNICRIEIPDSVKEIASSAFEGWDDTQEIIADWYEGNVENWKEWFDYKCEFGDVDDIIRRGKEIGDDMKCKLSLWWEQWKNSDYWNEIKEGIEEGSSAIREGADSFFGYWNDFGRFITSEDDGDLSEKPEWWGKVKDIGGYIGEKSKGIEIEIPDSIKDIIDGNRDQIDSYIGFIKEKAEGFTMPDFGSFFSGLRDKWANEWSGFFSDIDFFG